MSHNKKFNVVFISGLGVRPNIVEGFLKNIYPDVNCECLSYPDSQSVSGKTPEDKLSSIISILNKKIPHDSILIGWSLGGLIASKLMASSPKKYRGLMTICSTLKFVEDYNWVGISKDNIRVFEKLLQSDVDLLINKFINLILYPYVRNKCLKEKLSKLMFKNDFIFYFDLLMKADVRHAFSSVQNRSLHIYGDSDAVLPVSIAENYSVAGNVQVIKGAGHLPFFTHKELLLPIVKYFIKHCEACFE